MDEKDKTTLAKFLEYNSDELSTVIKDELVKKALVDLLVASNSTTISSTPAGHISESAIKHGGSSAEKVSGKGIGEIVVEDDFDDDFNDYFNGVPKKPEKTTEEEAREFFMAELNKELEERQFDPPKFDLNGPVKLTVVRHNSFTKKSHIGGETFALRRVYLGRRGQMIFVFRPVDVAEYETMEMTELQANRYLDGFERWVADATPQTKALVTQWRKKKAEAAKNAEDNRRKDNYGVDYGSW